MKQLDVIPKTRREQFFLLVRTRWSDMMFASIYLFIFFVPCLVWMLLLSNINVGDNLLNSVVSYGIMILPIMIFGLGMGGALYSFKRMCYSEGANIHHDFFLGIKKNMVDFLKLYFAIGVLYFAFHVGIAIVTNSNLGTNIISALEGILIVAYILFMIILMYTQMQMVFYSGGFIKLSLNSIKFAFGLIVKNLGMIILSLLPFWVFEFINFVPNDLVISITHWVCIGISALFYFGFGQMMFLEYTIAVFDESINKNQYPELVKKGLDKNDEEDNIDLSSI